MNREELINALLEIKEECSKHLDCENCKLYNRKYDDCPIGTEDKIHPCEWDIND